MSYMNLMYLFISFFGVIFSLPIFWLVGKIIRNHKFITFLKIWIDLLFINFIVSIVMLTNPFQNYSIIFLVLTVIYYLLFYVYSKRSFGFEILKDIFNDKPKTKSIDKEKRYSIFLISLYGLVVFLILIVGKGEMMTQIGQYSEISNNIIIKNNNGSILFDNTGIGTYNIGIFDKDKDTYYETIKYDINRDGKADIIHIDTNGDFSIDETIYKTYQTQRAYILIIFFLVGIFSIILIVRSGKNLKALLNEIYKRKMQEDNQLENKIGKEIIMSEIKDTSTEKQPKKIDNSQLSFNELIKNKTLKQNELKDNVTSSDYQEKIEEKRKELTKLTDMLIDGQIDHETYEKQGKEIQNNIDKLKENLNNGTKILGIISGFIFYGFLLFLITENTVFAIQISDVSQIQVRHKECVKDPYNDKKCIGVSGDYRKFFQHMTNPTFKKEVDQWIEKIQDSNYTPGQRAEINKQRAIRWNKWKKIDPQNSIYAQSFKYKNLFRQSNLQFYAQESDSIFLNENIQNYYKKLGDKKDINKIEYLELLDSFYRYENQIVLGSGKLLKDINIINKDNAINKSSNKEQIIKSIENRNNKYGTKADYYFLAARLNLENYGGKNLDIDVEGIKYGLDPYTISPIIKTVKLMGSELYNIDDYNLYSLIPTYNSNKVLGIITITNFVSYNLKSNPIDCLTHYTSNIFNQFQLNSLGNWIKSISISKLSRDIIIDSHKISPSETYGAKMYYWGQLSGKAKDIQGGNTTLNIGKFKALSGYLYSSSVLTFQKNWETLDHSAYLWIEGIKFISKGICGIFK